MYDHTVAPAGSETNAAAAQFLHGTLSRSSLDASPSTLFHAWFRDAQTSGQVPHPETMTLSTATLPSGRVSARMVYLKTLDTSGFVFYSNFGTSRKAHDLETNPYASLVFWWEPLERQVRVEGRVERLTREESQRYFDLRARGSRCGAWASRQSAVLNPRRSDGSTKTEDEHVDDDDGRAELEEQVKEVETKFEGTEKIPVPDFWGGARVVPEVVEFWQGRDSRLHDRFVYTRVGKGDNKDAVEGEGVWKIDRLSP